MKAINTYVYDVIQSDSVTIDFSLIVEAIINDLKGPGGEEPSTEDIITMFGDNMEEYIIQSTRKRNFCGDPHPLWPLCKGRSRREHQRCNL